MLVSAVQLGRHQSGKLGPDVTKLLVFVTVQGCRVDPEVEVLEFDAEDLMNSFHRVSIPPGFAPRSFECRARVEAESKTVFDSTFSVQRRTSPSGSLAAPRVSIQSSSDSTGSSSWSSCSELAPALRSTPKITELLMFACSPVAHELSEALPEAMNVASVCNWRLGVEMDIHCGGDAEQLRAALCDSRVRRFLFIGHADAESGGEKTLGFTKPGGQLETIHPPQKLADMLGSHATAHGGALELVFLNGCCSEQLGRAIHQAGVPHVVCWRTKCRDDAARLFSKAFFSTHRQGKSYVTAFEEAKRCREEGKEEVILIHLCGHGHFDLGAYETYLRGELKLHELTEEEIAASLAKLDTPVLQ